MIDHFLLLLGFFFTFFVPGIYLLENFFPRLPVRIKLPLGMLLSVIASSYLVYLISLILGFSRYAILVSFAFFVPWLIYSFRDFLAVFASYYQKHRKALLLGVGVFAFYVLALYPGIFTQYHNYWVMSSVNWQDTAMHLGIIESLAQGNFPPQAPYFSGQPLSYYYFADFHSAIMVTLFGRFFPRILVWDNPLMAVVFALGVYALAFELTCKKTISLISSFTATFFGSFIFVNFFSDLFKNINGPLFRNIFSLLRDHTYSMDYEGLFSMANLGDYFLQNRPMMIGLSFVILNLLILIRAFRKKDAKLIFLAGLITGLMIKFQFFAVAVSLIVFALATLFYFARKKVGFSFKALLFFLLPLLFSYLLFSVRSVGEQSFIGLVKENFSFGPWERDRSLPWHLEFIFANFGFPFLVNLIAIFYFSYRLIRKMKVQKEIIFLSLLSLLFLIIPYSVRFTIYKGDMFKFFYFMVVFNVVVCFWFLDTLLKKQKIKILIFAFVVVVSVFSSVLTLLNSFLNKNMAYSQDEYQAGLFIRQETPSQSVFLSLPTVHSPVTQIGGRLRVLSYINWPYSHGFNVGKDNVFSRLEDVEGFYINANDPNKVKSVISRYNVGYVYFGNEEERKYPKAETAFDSSLLLLKVYENEEIKLYQVK